MRMLQRWGGLVPIIALSACAAQGSAGGVSSDAREVQPRDDQSASGSGGRPSTPDSGATGVGGAAGVDAPLDQAFLSDGRTDAAPDGSPPRGDVAPTPAGPALIRLVAGGGDGADGAAALMARLADPYGAVVDPVTGELYIVEAAGERVRRVDGNGIISTVLGAGASGAGAAITLSTPHDLLFQPGTRNLFVADTMANRVIKLDAATGAISVFAGRGTTLGAGAGIVYCLAFSPDGGLLYFTAGANIQVVDLETTTVRPAVNYANARVIAVDSKGTLYAVRVGGNVLHVVDAAGRTTSMAGTMGRIDAPKRITVDTDDNVVLADTENELIRRYVVARDLLVTVAGNGTAGTGLLDGPPERAQLRRPHGVFVDRAGVLYVADSENNRVLQIVSVP